MSKQPLSSKKANTGILIRTVILMALCGVLLFIPLLFKLYNIQIVRHDELEGKAIDQQTRDTVISPLRGAIYDRNYTALAVSASVETIFISPKDIKGVKATKDTKGMTAEEQAALIARGLSDILDVDYEGVLERTKIDNYYQVIKRKVEKTLADEVRAFISEHKLQEAIHVEPDYKRYYPYSNFASHIIGFVSDDNIGLWGVEAQFNETLTGKPGKIIVAKDARGLSMPLQYEKYYDAEQGLSLTLTLDKTIQDLLKKQLENAVIEFGVENRAAAIVMSVKTGEILAMDTQYDYDLNAPRALVDPEQLAQLSQLEGETRQEFLSESQLEMWRNKAVNDTYEPGSTFKILTAAMALEEGVVKEDDHFSCSGSVMVPGWPKPIRCHKRTGHGAETFVQGVQNSCNPVFIAVAQRIGREKFYEYFKAFGLTEKTNIDLMGESGSIYHSWDAFNQNDVTLSVYAFGQTFKITPIQLITAISAVANGGKLMKPFVIKEMLDQNNNIVMENKPTVVRQVISEETSRRMCDILESVVTIGTGKNAFVKGYRVAGKTGTSQKRDPITNQYMEGRYIVSFAGFAPADNPEIAVLVLLDEPMNAPSNLRSGGNMAAPLVGRIMADILPYLGIEPQYEEGDKAGTEYITPTLVGYKVSDAEKLLKEKEIEYTIQGEGETVSTQVPASGSRVPYTAKVILYLGDAAPKDGVSVPDVRQMTYTQAEQALSNAGFYMRGTGAQAGAGVTAFKQSVAPGEKIKAGAVIEVEFHDSATTDFAQVEQ